MGGAMISVETKTKDEAEQQLVQHKKLAQRMGLTDERTRYVGYDDKEKVWRGYIWLHS